MTKEKQAQPIDYELEEYYVYLEKLRKSGKTNMYGAGKYLVKQFGIKMETAHTILLNWMKNYQELKKHYNW